MTFEFDVSRVVYANQATMCANLNRALDIFGEVVDYCSAFQGGQNCILTFLPEFEIMDLVLATSCAKEGVGVYPLSCFLARSNVPPIAHRSIRLTLSTPSQTFDDACMLTRKVVDKLPRTGVRPSG